MASVENLINAPEFTVSELSSALKRTVEDAYGHVRVRGEISGFRGPHSSGNVQNCLLSSATPASTAPSSA